jgi:hypothetical protein
MPWRRSAVPADLKRRVAVSVDERIIGWSWLPGDGWAVATPSALVVADSERGDDDPLHIPWDRIVKATWTDGALEVVGVADGTTANARYVLAIDEDGLLAESVRTLVTGAIAWSQRVDEGPGRRAWFAARRSATGGITWAVTFDAGLDAADPKLRAWADGHLVRFREATGLE